MHIVDITSVWFMDSASIMVLLLLLLFWINRVPTLVSFIQRYYLGAIAIMGFNKGTCAGKHVTMGLYTNT